MELNLTDIISTATREFAGAPTDSKLSVSIVVLGYLLGRDVVKYVVPILQKYVEQKIKESIAVKLE